MHSPIIILAIGHCADDQHAQHGAIAAAEPGWKIEFCDSGYKALSHIRQLQPQCIILDDQLADMTGLECFRAVRADPANLMPVLMLTSREEQSGMAEALRSGVQDYLFKDARGNYLALLPAVLKKLLREHRIDQEKKAVQASLAKLSHQYESLFQHVSDGIVLADGSCVIASINPATCSMFGYRPVELCGQPLGVLLHPDDRRDYAARFIGCGVQQVRGRRRDGELFPLEISVTDVGFKERHMFACVMRDATQHSAVQDVQDVLPDDAAPNRLVRHQAGRDALTGLWSRSEFELAATRFLHAARLLHQRHALLHLDINGFKGGNDRCAPLDDQLLHRLANLLQSRMRKSDMLARLGDDEFGILLGDCPAGRARDIAQQLIDAVRGFRFEWEDARLKVDVSIGVVALTDRAHDLRTMLDAANAACRIASDKGGGCLHVFEQNGPDPQEPPRQPDRTGQLQAAMEQNR